VTVKGATVYNEVRISEGYDVLKSQASEEITFDNFSDRKQSR
jgi:hypothetical protein